MAMALEDVAMWLVHWLVGELAVARSFRRWLLRSDSLDSTRLTRSIQVLGEI